MCPRAVVEREITKSISKQKETKHDEEANHSFSPSRSFFESGLQN